MHRIFLSCLAVLVSAVTFAQTTDLVIIPRVEGMMTKSVTDSRAKFGLGWSSLYTDLDGTFRNDAFSYSVEARFLSSDPASLYDYENPCANGTWLNWAYLAYDGDVFGASIGKMCILNALTEFESFDYDVHTSLASNTWLSTNTYQYGAEVRVTPFENHTFSFQISSSPITLKTSDLDFAYSARWQGSFGIYTAAVSFNGLRYTVQDDDGQSGLRQWNHMISIGNRFEFNGWNLLIDLTNSPYGDFDEWNYSDFTGWFNYTGNSFVHCGAMFGLQNLNQPAYGGYLDFYPMKDDNLRIHMEVSNRSYDIYEYLCKSFMMASIGVTYKLGFHFGKQRPSE